MLSQMIHSQNGWEKVSHTQSKLCPSVHPVHLSVCSSVCVSHRVRSVSPEPLNHFVTKLGMVVYNHEVMCLAEKLVHCLQCRGHSKGLYMIKIWLFLLYLLNCWFVCKQTWFGSSTSTAS